MEREGGAIDPLEEVEVDERLQERGRGAGDLLEDGEIDMCLQVWGGGGGERGVRVEGREFVGRRRQCARVCEGVAVSPSPLNHVRLLHAFGATRSLSTMCNSMRCSCERDGWMGRVGSA
eukprot:365222-Chlamydomonas_euryale.AAC.18